MTYRKYGNKLTVVGSITFHSKREAAYYQQLLVLQKAGKIRDLVLQQKFHFIIEGKPVVIRSKGFPNGRKLCYRADFSFFDIEQNRHRVIDVKGFQDHVSKVKIALVEAFHGITVEIVK